MGGKTPKLDDYPIDTTVVPKASGVYFLRSAAGFSNAVHVLDLTSVADAASYHGELTDDFYAQVESLAKEKVSDRGAEVFTLTKKAWHSLSLQLGDGEGGVVAEIDTSLAKLGTWKIAFPPGSPRSTHDVEMRPVAPGREEMFVKDSVPYFWDMQPGKRGTVYQAMGGKQGTLYKVVGGRRVQIAEFASRHGYDKDYVLILDSEQLDEAVVLATCVACLNRMYSFEKW